MRRPRVFQHGSTAALIGTALSIVNPAIAQVGEGSGSPLSESPVAFTYTGFETTVNTTDDGALRSVKPPRPASKSAPPENRPRGVLFDGLLYTTGENAFWTQSVDRLQGVVPPDWTSLADREYRFPARATNFCGFSENFAWYGLGAAGIRVLDAAPMTGEVNALLNYSRMLRDLTIEPVATFGQVSDIRAGKIVKHEMHDDDPGLRLHLEFQSDDGEYRMIYDAWFAKGADSLPSRWNLLQKKLNTNSTIIWRIEIAPFPTRFLRMPNSPDEIPSVLYNVDDPRSLIYLDETSTEWPPGVMVDRRDPDRDRASSFMDGLRVALGALGLPVVAFWYIRRRSHPQKEKQT